MHDEIKKFTMDGIVSDEADIVTNKEILVKWVEDSMRDEGYAPVLDVDPQYTQTYNSEKDQFEFLLTVYGIYVGEEEAWQTAGVMTGKKILKYTPPAKSKES